MQIGLTRRNIGRLVLLTWAVALAWLARRQFSDQGSAGVVERARRLEPGAQYFAVMAGTRQIGQLNLSVDTLVDGVRLSEQFVLDLPLGDSTRQLARGSEYLLSRSLRLRQFTRTRFGIGPAERLAGGVGADSMLGLSDREGGTQPSGSMTLRVEPEAILPSMLPYRAAFGGHLRVGERFTLPLIELGAGAVRPLLVTVAAESTFIVPDSAVWDSAGAVWIPATTDTLRAWRLDHDAPGAPTQSWVDAGGSLVRQETAGGVTLQRSAFEIVRNNYRRTDRTGSSAWRRAIPGMLPLIGAGPPDTVAATRRFLRAPDSAAGASASTAPFSGGRQSWHGDTLVVARDAPGEDAMAPAAAAGPAWYLAPGGQVRGTARLAVAGARTAWDSAAALTRWVGRAVASDTTAAASGTALNTFRARRGNADGKARLLAALARSIGIPARVVSGLAPLPRGVYSHSWVELWLDHWVAADPSFGHFPASASLVRIAFGEGSRPVDLLPLVASARFLPIRVVR